MITVELADEQEALQLDEALVRRAVRAVLEGEFEGEACINVALVDDGMIHQLNRQFLGHDWPTDVLSFPLEEGEGHLEGEIVISTDTAISSAARFGWSPVEELTLYLIHGALHLAGYDDHADDDRRAMREREDYYLAQLGLSPRPLEAADDERMIVAESGPRGGAHS